MKTTEVIFATMIGQRTARAKGGSRHLPQKLQMETAVVDDGVVLVQVRGAIMVDHDHGRPWSIMVDHR